MKNLFNKLRESLNKTRDSLTLGVRRVLAGMRPVDEALFEDLEEVLVGADVGLATTEKILDRVRDRTRMEAIRDSSGVEAILRDEIAKLMRSDRTPVLDENVKPRVILVVGVNGVGKTTTIGKLALRFSSENRRVLIAASDTFRAAAVEQLAVWADRAGVELVKSGHGADPAAVAFDGLDAALSRGSDVLIVDTAGRLQTKVNLMEELKKIGRVLSRRMPGAPHEVLLVLDASTGQNAVIQAREFNASMGVTGLVLTKLDGTAKGGIVLAIADQLGVPVRYLGVGEGIDDLTDFDPDQFAAALFESESSVG